MTTFSVPVRFAAIFAMAATATAAQASPAVGGELGEAFTGGARALQRRTLLAPPPPPPPRNPGGSAPPSSLINCCVCGFTMARND